jgi:periplasmic copper chaperone A
MIMRMNFAFALPFLLSCSAVAAQVTVDKAWVRATVAQQTSTGAFFQLKASSDARLVEVGSPLAGVAEIHEMAMEGSTMRMRAVAGIDVPAGKMIELKPGGYHLMLMDLKQPIKVGDAVPLTLVFEGRDKKRQTVELKAQVRPLGGSAKSMP